ncbi:MAG: hypothetical protein GC151_19070 [Betaproteobacteria bacterium]|nr:hypothetical protein [Betaproteobacteria bacterium]
MNDVEQAPRRGSPRRGLVEPAPIRTILIANRSEIAIRVMRAASGLYIRTVWKRPRPGSHGRPDRSPTRVRVREGESGPVPDRHDARARRLTRAPGAARDSATVPS